jgi:ribosomal protein L29
MTTLKAKEIKKMNKEDRAKKMEELKFELVKARANASKSGTSKAKEIKKIIARILTFNNQENKTLKVVEKQE